MHLLTARGHIRANSSVGSEHLVYTQGVGGSNPSLPTSLKIPMNGVHRDFSFPKRVELAQKRGGNEKSINALERIGILIAAVVIEGSRK